MYLLYIYFLIFYVFFYYKENKNCPGNCVIIVVNVHCTLDLKLLFQFCLVALSVRIFSLYKFWAYINLYGVMWDNTQNLGPIGSAVLMLFGCKQTNNLTNRHPDVDKQSIYIDEIPHPHTHFLLSFEPKFVFRFILYSNLNEWSSPPGPNPCYMNDTAL